MPLLICPHTPDTCGGCESNNAPAGWVHLIIIGPSLERQSEFINVYYGCCCISWFFHILKLVLPRVIRRGKFPYLGVVYLIHVIHFAVDGFHNVLLNRAIRYHNLLKCI